MPKPRVLLLRAPGTNCDGETAFAFEQARAAVELLPIKQVLDAPDLLREFQIFCLPGGFSYGDDVSAGKVLATQLDRRLGVHLSAFRDRGGLILGICNGFQVLIKSGLLLPPDESGGIPATLTWNDSGKFEDRWVRLQSSGDKCVFLRGVEQLELPIAHAEGKFVVREARQWTDIIPAGQAVLRYVGPADAQTGRVAYPHNPNGSLGDLAGLCDATGQVFGLMPHPERYIDRTQHPRWTRGAGTDPGQGLQLFENAVQHFD